MSEKIDLIYDLVKTIDAKQDQQIEKLAKLEVNVDVNTRDLATHIKRTDLLERIVDQNRESLEREINDLKTPTKSILFLGKVIVWLGGISGALITILKLLNIL